MNAGTGLAQLLHGIVPVARDVVLADLAIDSRRVRARGAFLACAGTRQHGLAFAQDAVARGAAAILWDPQGAGAAPDVDAQVVTVAVPGLSARASQIADRFFGSPSAQMDVIGVTGTNGKTTCAWLLAQALSACGRPTAYLGTLGAAFGDTQETGELTTPDAVTVQRQLAGFRDRGAQAVAMEVSSHALVQQRVACVAFRAAVFTNLTRDHLDFHGDMVRYGAAKASLFERSDVQLRVFNVDDPFGAELAARPAFAGRIACSRRDVARQDGPYLAARACRFSREGVDFTLESDFGTAEVRAPLMGDFNVDNLLAVLAVLLGSGVPLHEAVQAMAGLAPPDGRLENFHVAGRPLVVVDYAHTPDALEKVLGLLRHYCRGRLWCVFGCGGDRDRGKRPLMGAVAARLADHVVITDDNPRTEDPGVIVSGILAGMPQGVARVVHDRREAILQAVASAAPQDVVLVAGKGHERYQLAGTRRYRFSDQDVVREALARMPAEVGHS